MPDDQLARLRPGAFQHASFGKRDGWFIIIQSLTLVGSLSSAGALLPVIGRLLQSNAFGGGLTSSAAVGVMMYGIWSYGLTSFRRWAIAALPLVTGLLLVLMAMILAIPLVGADPVVPGDQPLVTGFNEVAACLAAVLLALACWRMRGSEFREYNRAAWGSK